MEEIRDPRMEGINGLDGIRVDDGYNEKVETPSSTTSNQNEIEYNKDYYDSYRNSLREQYKTPTYNGHDEIGVGASGRRFGEDERDNAIVPTNAIDLVNQNRANNQSGIAKVTNGLLKTGILASTTYLDGTLGALVGLANKVSGDTYYNNVFKDAMDRINQWSERALPNYYTEDEIDNPLAIRNIFSANFLGDKFLKNLGFTYGAMAAATTWNLLIPGSGIAAGIAKTIAGTALSAVNEGSIEAYNGAKEFKSAQNQITNIDIQRQLNELNNWYEENNTNTLSPIKDYEGNVIGYSNPIAEEYDRRRAIILDNYNKTQERINADAEKVGSNILAHNIPLLMMGNLLEFGKFLGGFDTTRRAIASSYKGKGIVTNLVNRVKEGAEEGSQSDIASAASYRYSQDVQNFVANGYDESTRESVLNWTDAYARAIKENLADPGVWEERLIGGLTGGMGMVSIGRQNNKNAIIGKNKVIGINGGIISDIRENAENLEKKNEADKAVSDFLNNSERTQSLINTLTRAVIINEKQNKAAEANSKFDYENATSESDFNIINYFANSGRLDELKAMINKTLDANDEESYNKLVEQIVDKNDNGSYKVGVFTDSQGNKISFEEGKEKINKYKSELENSIDSYLKVRNSIDKDFGSELTDDQLAELTWLGFNIDNLNGRGESMIDTIKEYTKAKSEFIGNNISLISEKISQLSKSNPKELKKSSNDIQKEIDTLSKEITSLQNRKSFLDSFSTAKSKTILSQINTKIGSVINLSRIVSEISTNDGFSDSSEIDESNILDMVEDLYKVAEIKEKYNNKLKEYKDNPSKIEEDTKREINKKAKKAKIDKRKNLVSELKNAKSIKDVKNILSKNDIDDNDAHNAIAEAEDNEFVKTHKVLTINVKNIKSQLNKNARDAQELSDAIKILDSIMDNGTEIDDLYDIGSPFYNNADIFKETNNPNDDKDNKQAQTRLNNAVRLISDTIKALGTDIRATPDGADTGITAASALGIGDSNQEVQQGGSNKNAGQQIKNENISVETIDGEQTLVFHSSDSAQDESVSEDVYDKSSSSYKSNDGNEQIETSGQKSSKWRQMVGRYDIGKLKEKYELEELDDEKFKIHKYLKDKGAFDFVENGSLEEYKQKDGVVYFGIDTSFEDDYGFKLEKNGIVKKYTILMYAKKDNGEYQVIGSLPVSSAKINQYEGMQEFVNDILNEFANSTSNDEVFISSQYTSKVAQINPGYVISDKAGNHNLKDVAVGVKDTCFFVVKNGEISAGISANDKENARLNGLNDSVLQKQNSVERNGLGYIAAPNAKYGEVGGRTLFAVIPSEVDSLIINNDSAFAKSLLKAIRNFVKFKDKLNVSDVSEISSAFMEIGKYIQLGGVDFHINENRISFFFKDSPDKRIIQFNSNSENGLTEEQIVSAILDRFNKMGLRYRLNYNMINRGTYNEDVINSGLFYTHVTSLTTHSPWFYVDKASKSVEAKDINKSNIKEDVVKEQEARPQQPVQNSEGAKPAALSTLDRMRKRAAKTAQDKQAQQNAIKKGNDSAKNSKPTSNNTNNNEQSNPQKSDEDAKRKANLINIILTQHKDQYGGSKEELEALSTEKVQQLLNNIIKCSW